MIIDEERNRRSKPDTHVPVEMAARLEEIYTIFEGTSEIQRLVIAREVLKSAKKSNS